MVRDMPAVERSRFDAVWDEQNFGGAFAWDAMQRMFETAKAARPGEVCCASFQFAGQPVSLTVVGRELFGEIAKPFAHLRVEAAAPPALRIELWDDRITGMLPPPEREDGQALWREATLRSTDDRYIAQKLPHTLSCLDRESAHLVAAIAWHDRIFIYERSKPLARHILTWCNDRQTQLIHTGLVARGDVGVLIAGKSGSGKSTSALASLVGGLDYLGEDYVALETSPTRGFVGHSLYGSVFLNSTHLARFAELAPHAINGRPPQEEKSVVLVSQVFPDRMKRSATIRAIVFPQVGACANASISAMPKAAALLALAPSSLLQIPNRQLGATGFERLADLVGELPCYRMTVGSDFAEIPRCIDEVIGSVALQ